MNFKLAAVIALSLIAGAVAAVAAIPSLRQAILPAPMQKSSGKALIGGPFKLVNHRGETVTDQTYRGKYTLVYFGFTHCPDICPASLQVISVAIEKLGKDADKIVPLFISVDPDRDTVEKMADYVGSFNPRIVGLTGTEAAVRQAARAYRVYYAKVENKDYPDDYTVDHSSFYYLMDDKGEFVTHFPHGINADDLSKAIAKALN